MAEIRPNLKAICQKKGHWGLHVTKEILEIRVKVSNLVIRVEVAPEN